MLKFIDGLFYEIYSFYESYFDYLPYANNQIKAASLMGVIFSMLLFGISHLLGFNLFMHLGRMSILIPAFVMCLFYWRYWSFDKNSNSQFQNKKGWLILLLFTLVSTSLFYFSLIN